VGGPRVHQRCFAPRGRLYTGKKTVVRKKLRGIKVSLEKRMCLSGELGSRRKGTPPKRWLIEGQKRKVHVCGEKFEWRGEERAMPVAGEKKDNGGVYREGGSDRDCEKSFRGGKTCRWPFVDQAWSSPRKRIRRTLAPKNSSAVRRKKAWIPPRANTLGGERERPTPTNSSEGVENRYLGKRG